MGDEDMMRDDAKRRCEETMRRDDAKRRCEETMRRDDVDGVVVVVVVTREVKRTNVKVAMIEHRPNAASFIPQCDP